MKSKIMGILKFDRLVQSGIFIFLLTYIMTKVNSKYSILFIMSCLILSYMLIRSYYNTNKDRIEYGILTTADMMYTFLGSFNLRYIIIYVVMFIGVVYLDYRQGAKESMGNSLEFLSIYTLFKILLLVLMIAI